MVAKCRQLQTMRSSKMGLPKPGKYQATAISASCTRIASVGKEEFHTYQIHKNPTISRLCWGIKDGWKESYTTLLAICWGLSPDGKILAIGTINGGLDVRWAGPNNEFSTVVNITGRPIHSEMKCIAFLPYSKLMTPYAQRRTGFDVMGSGQREKNHH
jgi:hypothetical protein